MSKFGSQNTHIYDWYASHYGIFLFNKSVPSFESKILYKVLLYWSGRCHFEEFGVCIFPNFYFFLICSTLFGLSLVMTVSNLDSSKKMWPVFSAEISRITMDSEYGIYILQLKELQRVMMQKYLHNICLHFLRRTQIQNICNSNAIGHDPKWPW